MNYLILGINGEVGKAILKLYIIQMINLYLHIIQKAKIKK